MSSGDASAPALAGDRSGAVEAEVERLRCAAGPDVPAAAASATDAAAAAEG